MAESLRSHDGSLCYLETNEQEITRKIRNINNAIELAVKNKESGRPPVNKKYRLLLYVSGNGQTQFLPIEPSSESWPLFYLLSELTTWEKRKEWLQKQLLNNIKPLLHNNIYLSLRVYNGSIRVVARPANAFTWATGRLSLEKTSLCICKAPTSGSKYCSRKCELNAMSTGVKQSFLDYLNKQVKRGKITSEESKFTKEYVVKSFKMEDSKDKLLSKVLKSLNKKYPYRDFSFLNGFGSRKSKQK